MDRLLSLASVAEVYGVSTRTIRRWLAGDEAARAWVAVPCRVRPYRWRASDVSAHLRRLTVADQLQSDARKGAA